MCNVLKIYGSSYYNSANKKPTKRDIKNLALTDIIKRSLANTKAGMDQKEY